MKHFFLLFAFVGFLGTAHAQTNLVPDAIELAVLKDIYDSLNVAGWTIKTNWPTPGNWPTNATSAQFATWYGLSVANGDVTSIYVASNNVTGKIPSSIGNLSELKGLALPTNAITGKIPASIGNLSKMENIRLYQNQLSGAVPSSIGNLSKLNFLNLMSNLLTSLPPEMNNLTELTFLNVGGNRLSNLPAMANLTKVSSLTLSYNPYTPGSIPTWLFSLTSLQGLNFNNSNLTGPIPSEIGQLTNLTSLNLNSNALTGALPAALFNLTNLGYLNLSVNQLSGSIPSQVGQLTKLTTLDVSMNQLSGQIPYSIANLTKLENLYLWNNQLTGSIPSSIGSMIALKQIQIYSNQLSGSIPVTIGALSNLSTLSLNFNKLTGKLPSEIGNLTKLTQLYLHGNQLSGTLPPELGSLTNLVYLYFHDNQFSGGLPSSFANMSKLKFFYASRNNLVGSIPSSFSALNQMSLFYVDGNKLSGAVPDNLFSSWTMLTQLNLANNYFTGAFPSSVSSCTQLAYFVANGNGFTSIPNAVLSFPLLTTIQFDNNELTSIPPFQNHVNKANLMLMLGNNRLDFSVLEPLMGAGIKTVNSLVQKNIRDVLTSSLIPGTDLTLTARPKGAATSNIKWEKLNGNTWTDVSSANADPVTGNTYRIAAATTSAEGKYRWSCTSTTVTGVTLTSDPIEVKVQERFTLDNLAFQYKYDGRKRMIEKKVPGADWVYMVYDDRDRLVLTQDGEQRKLNRWSFTKYDDLNRPILTGVRDTTVTLSQAQMQNVVNLYYEQKVSARWGESYVGSVAGNVHGYTNRSYPARTGKTTSEIDIGKFLTVTYYDSYAFKSLLRDDFNYQPAQLADQTVGGVTYQQPPAENLRVIGQVTGTKTKTLEASPYWFNTVTYFDDKSRVIQVQATNTKGGKDVTTNIFDFTGKVLATKTTHAKNSIEWISIAGCTWEGVALIKANVDGWNGGAASVEMLPAGHDGWMEVTATEITGARMIGFNDVNPDVSYTNIDYALYMYGSGQLLVYENASNRGSYGTYLPGDKLKVERIGTVVKYYKNNTLFYTSTVPSTTALFVDASLSYAGSTLADVRSSFSTSSKSTTRTFDYDHAGRLTKTWHQIDNNPKVLLAMNEYNELGQLVDKKLYNTDPPTTADASRQFKQSVDYRYNIRGWLSSINNAQLDNSNPQVNSDADVNQSDLFGMNLHYNDVVPNLTLSGQEQYNGNISSIEWKNYATTQQKGYGFAYDPMNRLTAANFATASADTWAASNAYHENGFTYDLNGNIMGLTRKGKGGATLDVLTYNYGANGNTGNQLITVTDTGDKNKGFVDGLNVDADYTYDANGNMTIDKNKGISTATGGVGITYNHLNLPEKVVKSTGEYMKYTYDATGRKLSQQTYNAANTLQKRTDYVGEYVYENDVLQFAQHEEGRVMMSDRAWLYQNDGTSMTGVTTLGVNTNFNTMNGEDYIVAISTTTAIGNGLFPIGGTRDVSVGDRYLIRARGYRAGTSDAALRIRSGGGTTDLIAGISLAPNAASERWVEQVVTIPPGVSTLEVGVVWKANAQNHQMYLNDFEIIKLSNATPEYQYHLKDHLGNVRTTFTTKDESEAPVATLETNHVTEDRANFLKYDDARLVYSTIFDKTNGTSPGYAQRLSGTSTEKMGLARSVAVMPGDKLKMEVYAKYFQASNNDAEAFVNWVASMVSGSSVPNSIVDGAGYTTNTANTTPFGNVLDKTNQGAGVPKAYLNWVIFDENYVPIMGKSGYRRITSTALQTVGTDGAHEKLESPEIEINEAGFAYIWLSNENEIPVEVYFDDFKVTHTKSPVVQSDDYYPFGLAFNSYSRENSTQNKYLYNQGAGEVKFNTERVTDLELNVDQTKYRTYDYTTGRWWQVDPKADMFFSLTPYNYSFNDPVRYNDPEGDCPTCPGAFVDLVVAAKLYWNRLSGATQRLASGTSGSIPSGAPVPNDVRQMEKMMGTMNDAKTVAQAVVDGPGRVGSFTDANDITVLAAGQNLDGTKATTGDYVFAGVGLFLPVSGSAIKKLAGAGLDVLEGITKKMGNISSHLTDKDVTGAVRDVLGDPVVIGGKTYDHLGEVNDALTGMGNQLEKLNKAISSGDLTGDVLKEAQRIRSSVQKEKDRIQNLLNKAQQAANE